MAHPEAVIAACSDRSSDLDECWTGTDAVVNCVHAESVVTASTVLDEGIPADDDAHGAVILRAGPWSVRREHPTRRICYAAAILLAAMVISCSSTAAVSGTSRPVAEPVVDAGDAAGGRTAPAQTPTTPEPSNVPESPPPRPPDATLPPLAANGFPVVPGAAAVALLDSLEVNDGGAPVPYDRKRFGPGWGDPDGDGCTGRQTAIITAAQPGSLHVGPHCQVSAVSIESLYDATLVDAQTAAEVGRLIQVDHIVSLKDAYRRLCCIAGPTAQRLRVLFYNDPENLIAVSTRSNLAKSDYLFGDARFHYTNQRAACLVADRIVRVKAAYQLTVETQEAKALRDQLAHCPPTPPPTPSG